MLNEVSLLDAYLRACCSALHVHGAAVQVTVLRRIAANKAIGTLLRRAGLHFVSVTWQEP
jgi:hypothetical protein